MNPGLGPRQGVQARRGTDGNQLFPVRTLLTVISLSMCAFVYQLADFRSVRADVAERFLLPTTCCMYQ